MQKVVYFFVWKMWLTVEEYGNDNACDRDSSYQIKL